jgi:hypothetical protein
MIIPCNPALEGWHKGDLMAKSITPPGKPKKSGKRGKPERPKKPGKPGNPDSPSEHPPSINVEPVSETVSASVSEASGKSDESALAAEASASPLEVLDIENFRVSQDYAARMQLAKRPVSIPVGRPNPQQFLMFHPDPTWRITLNVLEVRANRRTYLVAPELEPELLGDIITKQFAAYTTPAGSWGLWGFRLGGGPRPLDNYNLSGHQILAAHAGTWIRVVTDDQSGRFVAVPAVAAMMGLQQLPVPRWPAGGFTYLCDLAFRGLVIRDLNHLELRRLRGEVF